ncbi:hypothetical protein, partial [Lysinibacillus xylanilyticus]|uniref:hypothetical protein n=1 Tax=Lysinibacillus xylanilyticus TaxID=582475 RepID=UPI0036DC7BBD
DMKGATHLWSLVLDTYKFTKEKQTSLSSSLNKIISEAASTSMKVKSKPRKEVILTAQFIANIDPCYVNSDDQIVELYYLRGQVNLTEEEVDFLCEKIESVVKPYISVTGETAIDGQKLKVKTTMSKKKLIHAAVRHLMLGSEIFKDPYYYHVLKARAMFRENIKPNYAWLVGLALSLEYKSVPEMMEDMCIKFVDQTENVKRNGQVVFYDGAIRIESL